MSSVIDVWVDLRSRKLLAGQRSSSLDGTVGDWNFPRCLHNESLNIVWRFLQQNTVGDPKNPNVFLDLSGAALTVALFAPGSLTLCAQALPGSWTPGGAGQWLSGQLNLLTAEMIAQFAAVSALTFKGELKLVLSDGTYGMQFNVDVFKSLIETASGLPIPSAGYYTTDEMSAIFVKFRGNADGRTITLASPDGTYERIIGVRDDGSAQDDIT